MIQVFVEMTCFVQWSLTARVQLYHLMQDVKTHFGPLKSRIKSKESKEQ